MMAAGNKQFTNHTNSVPYSRNLKKMTWADWIPGRDDEHHINIVAGALR